MSHFVSYLADMTDPTFSTREVDLNAVETGTGIFETDHETFDLGAPDLDGVWLAEAGKDEDVLSAYRRGRVAASFDLRITTAPAIDNITSWVRRLNHALDRVGVWVIQQPGAALPMFVDYFPSPLVQQLMPGSRSLYHLWSQLQQPNGMRVTILRRPKMRGAALSADVNLAHNGTFAEDHDHDGVPSLWTWDSLTGLSGLTYDWTYGAHFAQFATAAPHFLSQPADTGVVTAGHTFTFAADVAGSWSTFPVIRARIDWLDGTGTQVGASVYGNAIGFLFGPASGFSRPQVLGALAPAGAVGARYGIEVVPSSTALLRLWVRDAQFETGNTANTFRPGYETITQTPGSAFYKRLWIKNAGNADALADIRAKPAIGHPPTRMIYGRRSGPRDSGLAMSANVTGWAAASSTALLNGTTAVADGALTVAKTSLRADVLRSILREASPVTDESALRGTWRLRASLRGDVNDAYQIDAVYGVGDVADLPYTSLDVPRRLDLTGPPEASAYYVVDLGFVRVPPNAPGLYVEVRGLRETTDGDNDGELYVEQVWLEPADDLYASVEVPGARGQGPVTRTVIGRKLATPPDGLANDPGTGSPFVAGTIYNDDLLLNDSLEACSLLAGATDALTAGVQHTFTVDVLMFTASEKVSRIHGELRVHNLTDHSQVTKVVLKNEPGVAWDEKSFAVRFTPAAGKAYLVYVVQTVANSIGNIHVHAIHRSFVPPIDGATDTIAIDGDQRLAYVIDDDQQIKAPLTLTPPFLVVEPGVQLLRVSFSGMGPNGSDVVLDGGPAQSHDPALTARFGVHHIPRWFN